MMVEGDDWLKIGLVQWEAVGISLDMEHSLWPGVFLVEHLGDVWKWRIGLLDNLGWKYKLIFQQTKFQLAKLTSGLCQSN